MFSRNWYETFSSTVPASTLDVELAGIARTFPVATYPRLLDIGCGIGRIAGPLDARGYAVTGLDVNVEALRIARTRAPGPRYVALDQRHLGAMRWTFDAAIVMWHSLGFADRASDREMLAGVARVLRPGGRLALELFHPGWMAANDKHGEADRRGASVRRWVRNGRCFHVIQYPDDSVDRIEFDLYDEAAISTLVVEAGLRVVDTMVWWDPSRRPGDDSARFQVICERPA
jgi:SAM-dependent methyltransferase